MSLTIYGALPALPTFTYKGVYQMVKTHSLTVVLIQQEPSEPVYELWDYNLLVRRTLQLGEILGYIDTFYRHKIQNEKGGDTE